jgi:hypothetical protein
MVNRKSPAKALPRPAFSRNQNVIDAQTELADTQDAPNEKIAQNCSQVSYRRCSVGVDHLRVPMSEDIELMARDQQMRSSESE